MRTRSSLSASGYDIGDVKLRYALAANNIESSPVTFKGQEWLRTGYLTPYDVKYAAHLLSGIGRSLYAYDAITEQQMTTAVPNGAAQVSVEYYAGRYYFFPDFSGGFQVRIKAALDSAATGGTASAAMQGGVNITAMKAFFVIKTGANAGRVLVGTSGDAGYQLHYQSGGVLVGAWADAGLGDMLGTAGPRFLAGKPDGSLMVAVPSFVSATYGAGNIKTSTDGAGTGWTSRTSNLMTYTANVSEAAWCPTLDKFVFVGRWSLGDVMRYWSSADGFTWTVEAGVPQNVSGTPSTCYVADNGASTVVVGSGSQIFRSVAAGAFAAVNTPRQLVAIAATAGTFYAINSLGGVEMSTDNGTTWTSIGQINGPVAAGLAGTSSTLQLKVANGNLFYSTAGGLARFTLQPLPSLTPDKVGAVATVPAPSGTTSAAHFVRIL